MISSPRSEAELLARARALAGWAAGDIATRFGQSVPLDRRRSKGWFGELIETALGATGGSQPRPDFPALGVELKTIPVTRDGRPRESTHICTVPLADFADAHWETSLVRRKLSRVLWVPVDSAPGLPLPDQRLGNAILWSPDPVQEAALRADWEELMEMVATGHADAIRGEHGVCMQIRPKAAHGRARTRAYDAAGEACVTLPRGFYLRPAFTAVILRDAYAMGPAPST